MKHTLCFFRSLTLFLITAWFSAVSAQQSSDGMRVARDEQGVINNAMYFKEGMPISQWIQEKNLTKFQADWSSGKILKYLNKSLDIKLIPSLETSICLERTGDYYLENYKDFSNTEKFYLAATKMLEELGNINRSGYMYYYLGLLYHDWEKPEKADLWYQKSIKVYGAMPGRELTNYPLILKTIFARYIEEDRKIMAVPYLQAYLELENIPDSDPGDKSGLYLYLGDALWKDNRKDEAVAAYLKSVPYAEIKVGADSKDYQVFVKFIADQLYLENYKNEAEPLYRILFETGYNYFDESASNEINMKLLDIYIENLEVYKVLPVFERMMPYFESFKELKKEEYANIVYTMGLLFERAGKYDIAEKYLQDCLQIRKEILKESNPLIGTTKVELGLVYIKMYNVDQALLLANQGMDLINKSGKPDKYTSDIYLNIRGIAFLLKGEYKEAENAFNQLLEGMPRGGLNELDYAVSLGTLGTIYWYEKEYKKSEDTFLNAIGIFEKENAENWREYANLKGNLAMIYAKNGDFEKARKWAVSSMESHRCIQGETHPDYLTQKTNLSMYLEAEGNEEEAIVEALSGNHGVMSLVDRNLLYWSETEMEAFLNVHINRFFDYFHSLFFRNKENHPELAGQAYNNLLFSKGLLLQSYTKLQQTVEMSNDSLLHQLTEKQKRCRAELELLYASPVNERKLDPAILELESSGLQKQIKQRISRIGNLNNPLMKPKSDSEYDFVEVKNALKPNQAAIEFLSFNYHDKVRETDSIFYCALILCSHFQWPVMVFLTEENTLKELLKLHPDELYYADNQELYSNLWKPIEAYLKDIETIYYSPSGLLHRISFPAIATGNQKTLSDKYKLYNLASTRNLLASQPEMNSNTGVIFGGINYNSGVRSAASKTIESEQKQIPDDEKSAAFRKLRGAAWDFLPGTRVEAERISELLKQGNIKVISIEGEEATEEFMKGLNGHSPSMIHIASHGFSFPPENQLDMRRNLMMGGGMDVYTISKNPLMRSGLLFAGANIAWASGLLTEGTDDGILTAYELGNLDLSGTGLMVLSACETGLGEVQGNEGVFGLQRALFMAGVKSMVVSLWEVPDLETMELMSLFYENIIAGTDAESAFYLAQKEMKSRYPDQPSLWAGFVFIR